MEDVRCLQRVNKMGLRGLCPVPVPVSTMRLSYRPTGAFAPVCGIGRLAGLVGLSPADQHRLRCTPIFSAVICRRIQVRQQILQVPASVSLAFDVDPKTPVGHTAVFDRSA